MGIVLSLQRRAQWFHWCPWSGSSFDVLYPYEPDTADDDGDDGGCGDDDSDGGGGGRILAMMVMTAILK